MIAPSFLQLGVRDGRLFGSLIDVLNRGAPIALVATGMALVIAADTHPLHNLRVLNALRAQFGADEAAVNGWIGHWIGAGLDAFAALVDRHGGAFCHGDAPGLADCCLIPQLYSARRFGIDPAHWPATRTRIAARIAERTRAQWEAVFAGSDACVAPVLSLAEAPLHPHNQARGTFRQIAGHWVPAGAPRFSDGAGHGASD